MKKRGLHIAWLIATGVLLSGVFCSAEAQTSPAFYDYPRNYISWYTIESEHFLVHFPEGNSRSAQIASGIAEAVYPKITQLYRHEPDSRINIVLKDHQDYSNGAAYFFDNQIDIWIPALNSPLRGTHDWMHNVISHELTHIIQLQASMTRRRSVPALYLQWLSYEQVRRPDVLYGFPKGIMTYPFSSVNVPAWFAEGVAQYQASGWSYDRWDSHRDMLLRTSILNDSQLGFTEMGIFSSKNGLEREMVYNQGYAFAIYLANRFGEEVFARISQTLSQGRTARLDEAIRSATGISGRELFDEWIAALQHEYAKATSDIPGSRADIVETRGFLNLHPQVSNDGTRLAYLSNGERDGSTLSLIIRTPNDPSQTLSVGTGAVAATNRTGSHQWNVGAVSIENALSSFSFAPESDRIVFTRNTLNRYGAEYNDLFIYRITDKHTRRLTENERFRDPAWSPDGSRIVAVKEERGTKNLYLLDPESGDKQPLTRFRHGEQIYTPAWHPDGESVIFAFSNHDDRSISRVRIATGTVSTVLEQQGTDFRDPFVSSDGTRLYLSSDSTGIHNIYRYNLQEDTLRRLTNVSGGAFMPYLDSGGTLYYSEFRSGGYAIARTAVDPIDADRPDGRYTGSPVSKKRIEADNPIAPRWSANVSPLDPALFRKADSAAVSLQLPANQHTARRILYPYRDTFTGLSIYPVLRFDNYSKRNGSNGRLLTSGRFSDLAGNLWRDMKVGINLSSRDVIGRLSFFGGALFGFGSQAADGIGEFFSPARLTDLDRDLFLITEYRGFPFSDKRWSPTVSLELYNLRRNVRNGLTIEEFPCTACLPDSLSTDIAYGIWEADLFLRSKINRHTLLELGGGYSPYQAEIDGFFSSELQQFIPASSTEYFRSAFLTAAYYREHRVSYRHADIAPHGLDLELRYRYRPGELLDQFIVEDGSLKAIYETTRNHSLMFQASFGFPSVGSSHGEVSGRIFDYLNSPDDFFYLDYIGGFTGMRSYPYFAVGGNTTAYLRFSHLLPVATGINRQMGHHTFDKLFIRLFAEAGNGWNGPLEIGSSIKTGIGAELRFALNSYYLYPLKLFISGAYGFDSFRVQLPSEFITGSETGRVKYGGEPLFHFGLSFDFNPLNHE